jgi:integrase
MVSVVRLRHLHSFTDRHGRKRTYLRLPGMKAVQLPGAPGSPEFMAAYNAAVAAAVPKGDQAGRIIPGSLDALAISYYASPAFGGLRASTQAAYRRLVEEMRAGYGTRPVRLMEPRHVEALMHEKAGRPTAANHRLRLLRALLAHAVTIRMISVSPAANIGRVAYRTDGYHTWTEDEIATFEAKYPSGSRERLAFTLLLYTGQRRSDVVRMGRQHLREVVLDGRAVAAMEVTQVKTGKRLLLPVHPALVTEIDQTPRDRLTFLLTEFGKPFSPRGFYNLFADWAREAGLPPGRSPHGLRKAAGRRLAEAGATAHQIMSILGVTLQTAEIYTRQAEQARMAVAGMARLSGAER